MRLFDLHCDTLMLCEQQKKSFRQNDLHIDLDRGLAVYERWGQVTAAYVPDGLEDAAAWNLVCRQLTYLEVQVDAIDSMQIVRCATDLKNAVENGRCAVLPAVENGAALGRELSHIQQLAARGVVYINITWNGENPLGNGCMAACKSGLTAFGKAAVSEMLACHILPDVSHLNEAGFWDVVSICGERPFIAGHSVSMAQHRHPRNLTDEQFGAIHRVGGLVGVNLCEDQLGAQTFACLERHIYHFLSLGGENTVALGLDLDGTDIPSSWCGIEVASKLYAYLSGRGYDDTVLNKLFYENAYAFFAKSLTTKTECITIGS